MMRVITSDTSGLLRKSSPQLQLLQAGYNTRSQQDYIELRKYNDIYSNPITTACFSKNSRWFHEYYHKRVERYWPMVVENNKHNDIGI